MTGLISIQPSMGKKNKASKSNFSKAYYTSLKLLSIKPFIHFILFNIRKFPLCNVKNSNNRTFGFGSRFPSICVHFLLSRKSFLHTSIRLFDTILMDLGLGVTCSSASQWRQATSKYNRYSSTDSIFFSLNNRPINLQTQIGKHNMHMKIYTHNM